MAIRNMRPIYHEANPRALGNSIEGDEIAAKRKRWADRDVIYCLFGILIVTHWPDPTKEGWTYRGKPVTRPFSQIPLYRVLRMLSPDGYRIRTVGQAMKDAKRLGVPGIEFDLKRKLSLYRMRRFATAARKNWGPDWQRHVEVKMGTTFAWRTTLRNAHSVGFTTTLIDFHGQASELPSYVDKYRG